MEKKSSFDYSLLNDTKNAVIFSYLILVKFDYPYNITKNFQEAINSGIWPSNGLNINSYLTNPSKISAILKKLEANQIVKLDKREERRGNRSYYSINHEVFLNEVIIEELNERLLDHEVGNRTPALQRLHPITNKKLARLIAGFHFNPRLKRDNELDAIFKLSDWKKFDFYTVLYIFHYEIIRRYLRIIYQPPEKDPHGFHSFMDEDRMTWWAINFTDIYFKRYLEFILLSKYRKDIGLMLPKILETKKE